MHEKRDLGAMRRYERVGGLCFLAVFLLGGLTWLCSELTVLLVGEIDSLRSKTVLNLLIDGLSLAFLLVLLRRYLYDQLRRFLAKRWRSLLDLLSGFGVYYLSNMLLSPLVMLFAAGNPEYRNGNQNNLEMLFAVYPGWTLLLVCFASPLTEELLFRGLIFGNLYRRSRPLAYTVSALLFALPHVASYVAQVPLPVTLINLLLYIAPGLVLAWTYAHSGSLLTSVLLHAANNALALTLLRG